MKDRTKLILRFIAYVLCIGAACVLCVYWSDHHDWIKIPIILGIQFRSFEMLISRQELDSVYSVMTTTGGTTIYCLLLYMIWVPLAEPTPGNEATGLEFNTSAIGDCQLTRGSQVCFGDGMHGWFSSDYPIEEFDIKAINVVNTLSVLRESFMDSFGLSDEEWEECILLIYRIGCGSFYQMCDYSCKPRLLCVDVCHTALDTCGDEAAELFDTYLPVIKSLIASVGIEGDDADLLFQGFFDSFNGCKTFYANESDSLCMNIPDMYETNLTGISAQGACTRENSIKYEQYLESLSNESLDEYLDALNQYNINTDKIISRKLIFSLGMLISVSIFEIIGFVIPKYRKQLFDISYNIEIGFLSLFCRFRVMMMGVLAGFLCFILRSSALRLELEGIYVVLTLTCAMLSGFMSITMFFHQDRIASRYFVRITQIELKNQRKSRTKVFTVALLYERYAQWYKKNFSSTGKYEYWKYIVSEISEVTLQLNVMLSLAKTEDIVAVLANIVIISVNLIVSPLLLLNPSPVIWGSLNRFVDSCLDSAYLSLLYVTLTSRAEPATNSGSEILLGMLLPVIRLIARLYSLSNSVIRDFTKSKVGLNLQQQQEDMDSKMHKQGPDRIGKKTRLAIIVAFVSCGLLLLSSTLYRVISKTQLCKQEIGEDGWHAMDNHVIFPDGILQDTTCNFESVKLLNMSHSSLTEVSASLTKLVNLEVLDLSSNYLTTLPYELSQLNLLTYLDATANPVSTHLDWSGLGIEYYPYEFLKLIGTLESVDLSNNNISSLEDMGESQLLNLVELNLSRNKLTMISADYIQSLNSLITLNLSYNKLQGLDDSIWSILTLKNIDLRYNLFTELTWVWAMRQDGFVAKVKGNPVTSIDWSLSVSGRTIISLPEELSDLENLTSFKAKNQQIVSLGGLVSLERLQLLNLSYSLVVPDLDVCNVKSQAFLDFSYTSDSEMFGRLSCVDDDFIPIRWNISGFPMDFLTHPYSPVLSWIHAEHIVANDLQNGPYKNMSIVLSNLTKLRILSVRNSPIHSFDGALIPKNLTYFDLRNTSITLDKIQMNLPDFNCTYPTPYVCTRALEGSV